MREFTKYFCAYSEIEIIAILRPYYRMRTRIRTRIRNRIRNRIRTRIRNRIRTRMNMRIWTIAFSITLTLFEEEST